MTKRACDGNWVRSLLVRNQMQQQKETPEKHMRTFTSLTGQVHLGRYFLNCSLTGQALHLAKVQTLILIPKYTAQLTRAASLVQKMRTSDWGWITLSPQKNRSRVCLNAKVSVHFWCAPEGNCHIHTCLNKPHQGGKEITVRFNPTKWGRCESLQQWRQSRKHWQQHGEEGQTGDKGVWVPRSHTI